MFTLPPFVRRILIQLMRRKNRRPTKGQCKKKIGIYKVDRLGDFILAIGTIRFLQNLYGKEECTLVVSDFVADFARRVFPNTQIVTLPFEGDSLLRRILPTLLRKRRILRSLSFEKLVCLRHQRSIFHELVLPRISARESYGITNSMKWVHADDAKSHQFPLDFAADYPSEASPNFSRELEAHRRILSLVTGREMNDHEVIPSLDFTPAAEEGFILVSPFGSTRHRDYPNALLVEAMHMLQQQLASRFLLCGAPSDAERLQELLALALKKGIKNIEIRPTPSFTEFCSLVAAARGVLSVDTSTAHLATGLDKPTVVLLGGGHMGDFGPWYRSNNQAWLTHPMPCFYCFWKCIHPENYCLSRISPNEIAEALTQRIQQAES